MRKPFAITLDAGSSRARLEGPVDAAPTAKRVLVVGAGPSGLSAAYHLTRPNRPEAGRTFVPGARAICRYLVKPARMGWSQAATSGRQSGDRYEQQDYS
jgi:hypothetical protein